MIAGSVISVSAELGSRNSTLPFTESNASASSRSSSSSSFAASSSEENSTPSRLRSASTRALRASLAENRFRASRPGRGQDAGRDQTSLHLTSAASRTRPRRYRQPGEASVASCPDRPCPLPSLDAEAPKIPAIEAGTMPSAALPCTFRHRLGARLCLQSRAPFLGPSQPRSKTDRLVRLYPGTTIALPPDAPDRGGEWHKRIKPAGVEACPGCGRCGSCGCGRRRPRS